MALGIDQSCGFVQEGGYAEKHWVFFGKEDWVPEVFKFRAYHHDKQYDWDEGISKEALDQIKLHQQHTPVFMLAVSRRRWWWFRDTFYYTNDDFEDPLVIKELVLQKEHGGRDRKATTLIATHGKPPSMRTKAPPPQDKKSTTAIITPKQSPYQILGVPRNASNDEIRAAYRQRINEYHPDKVAALGSELRTLAEEMTKQITVAYEKLRSLRRL